MIETELRGETHGVDVMYGNREVYGQSNLIRDDVFVWLARQGKQGRDWGIVDRYPDDGFTGETFQFRTAGMAVMFKLAWGGQ